MFFNANAAGFGFPWKSRTEVFAGQGKQSCPHQSNIPPHFGNRDLQAETAMDNAFACLFWLHSTYSSKVFGARPSSCAKAPSSIHQVSGRLQAGLVAET